MTKPKQIPKGFKTCPTCCLCNKPSWNIEKNYCQNAYCEEWYNKPKQDKSKGVDKPFATKRGKETGGCKSFPASTEPLDWWEQELALINHEPTSDDDEEIFIKGKLREFERCKAQNSKAIYNLNDYWVIKCGNLVRKHEKVLEAQSKDYNRKLDIAQQTFEKGMQDFKQKYTECEGCDIILKRQAKQIFAKIKIWKETKFDSTRDRILALEAIEKEFGAENGLD